MARLREAGVAATPVSEVTGVPEILGGRVKTLHPAVFGGILAQRDRSEDLQTLEEHGIGRIDVVAVNLYPFGETVRRNGASDPEIIEQIDIGGVALLRAAAKNHRDVFVVVDPADYGAVLAALDDGREAEGRAARRRLAAQVFAHCCDYDRSIAAYLTQKKEGEDARATPDPLVRDRPAMDGGSDGAGRMRWP